MMYHFDQRLGIDYKTLDESDWINDVAAANHADALCTLWNVNVRCWRLEEGHPAGELFPGQEVEGKLVICDSKIPTPRRPRQRKDY